MGHREVGQKGGREGVRAIEGGKEWSDHVQDVCRVARASSVSCPGSECVASDGAPAGCHKL